VKCEKGTPEYKKVLKIVQRIHERIRNKREDFLHKLSRWLVNAFGIICFEKLNVKGMSKNHCLAKAYPLFPPPAGEGGCAWWQLVQYTLYKAESAGRVCVLVDPRNTSKMCSRCGCIIEIPLSERAFNCPHCGLTLDRDVNAAINILRLGLQSLGPPCEIEGHIPRVKP
jgi:putative transposase